MKYFAKYLPVEGEIGLGKNVPVIKAGYLTFLQIETKKKLEILKEFDGYKQGFYKPAKLFLCSRDIKVGDRIWNSLSGYGKVILRNDEEKDFVVKYESQEHSVSEDLINVVTIIGEISPDAKWVTEGMEFEEDEIKVKYNGKGSIDELIEYYSFPIWLIKCPHCGNFS